MTKISKFYQSKYGLQDTTPAAASASSGNGEVKLSKYYQRKMGLLDETEQTENRDWAEERLEQPTVKQPSFTWNVPADAQTRHERYQAVSPAQFQQDQTLLKKYGGSYENYLNDNRRSFDSAAEYEETVARAQQYNSQQDLLTAQNRVSKAQEQGEAMAAELQRIQRSAANLEGLLQRYQQSGNVVDGQAYLIAVDAHNQAVAAYNEQYDAYQKEWNDAQKSYETARQRAVKDQAGYFRAAERLEKEQAQKAEAALDRGTFAGEYSGGFGKSQEGNLPNRKLKAGIGRTLFDAADAGAGAFNSVIAQTVKLIAKAPMAVEDLLTGEHAFTGVALDPVLKWADWVIDTADYTKRRADAEAAAHGLGGQVASQLLQGTVAALPNTMLAILSAGGSVAPQIAGQAGGLVETARQAVLQLSKNPMFWTSVAQTLGSSYEEALAEGATEGEALVAAVLTAFANSAIEVGGGMETLPGELQNANLTNGQRAWKWLKSSLEEGGEELLQNPLQRLINKVLTGSDTTWFSTEDSNAVINPAVSAQEFGMGTAVGAILGGGTTLVDMTINPYQAPKTPEAALEDLKKAYQRFQITGNEQDAAAVVRASRVLREVTGGAENVQAVGDLDKKEDAAPFKTGADVIGEPGGVTSEISLSENVAGVNENVGEVAENVIDEGGRLAALPSDLRNDNRMEGIQWAGDKTNNKKITAWEEGFLGALEMFETLQDVESAKDLLRKTEKIKKEVLTYADKEPMANILANKLDNLSEKIKTTISQKWGIENGTEQQKVGQSGDAQRADLGNLDGRGAETAKRTAARAAIRRAGEARRVRANVEALGGELTSLRAIGMAEGSDQEIIRVVPREAWTPDVEEAWNLAESEGLEFVPVVGSLYAKAQSGKQIKFVAALQNGKIYAQADSLKQSIGEAVSHEIYHQKVAKDPGLQERVVRRIRNSYTPEETEAMYQRYYKEYQDTFGGKMTDEEIMDAVWEEMLADAYAEFQRYADTYGTAPWGEVVQDEVWSGGGERNIDSGTETKFSVAKLEGENRKYGPGVILDTDIFEGVKIRDWGKVLGNYVYNNLAGQEMTMYDAQGNPETVHIAKQTDRARKDGAKNNHKVLDELARYRGDNVKALATVHLSELLATSGNETTTNDKSHGWLDENGWRKRTFYAMTRNGKIYEGTLNIADGRNGLTVYKISAVHQVDTKKEGTPAAQVPASEEAARSTSRDPYGDRIAKKQKGVKTDFSVDTGTDRAEEIREELEQIVKPGLPNGPHAVPRSEAEVSDHIVRPEGMSDEEYAELDARWQNRGQNKFASRELTPIDELVIPKASFTSTPAMDKLGIKIDGSVARYRQTEQLRAYERAAREAQRVLKKRIKALKATEQEKYLANGIVTGNITLNALDDDNVNVGVVTELADYMMAARAFSEDMIAQRRGEINTANFRIASDLFKDSDAYHPKLKLAGLTKIVMNERTPERVVKQIFGQEQGQKIYETYFRPVWVNGAEMNRFENRMLDRVAKFEDKNGVKRAMTEQERMMAQRLMEGEAARDNVMRLDADIRERVESAAQNVNNGEEFVDAIREFGLAEEYHQGLVQAYADYLDTATMSKDMDQTILKNAIVTYQQIYNEMYDAINDFLVSHGYSEIGFIKGYAPHFQKRETQQGLFGALKSLGVEKESVSELPASIAGRTADFKPNMKWNPHMQSRKGSSTSYDIQLGFEQYLHYAAEMFYHTDDVMRVRQAVNWFRGEYAGETISNAIEDAQVDRYKSVEWKKEFLEKHDRIEAGSDPDGRAINRMYDEYVAELYEKAAPANLQKYSEFVTWLDNYANIVAGKQSLADRGLEYGGGRNMLNMGSKLMRRFSTANVAGNLSSVLNQSAQLPLIQQRLGVYLERAIWDMARGGIAKDNFVERSDFLTDKRGVDKLTMDNGEKFISALFKPAELMDRLVSTIAVRGRYLQALHEGMDMDAAMREADDFGRRVMGSRMKGAKPLGFESKTFVNQMLHVFQVEAANTFDYMLFSDMPQAVREVRKTKGKAAAARHVAGYVVGYLLNAFLLNRLTDDLYGGSPAPFDLMGWALNFAASGFGRTDEDFMKLLIDNAWEALFGERPFETERLRDEQGGIQWAGSTAVDDLGYNVLNDVPYVRNAMGLLGLGDQTLPTVGINEFAENVGNAGKTLWDQVFKGEEETGISWAGAARSIGENLLNAATQILPGGRQIKKTAQGAAAVLQGGKYSGERLQYPVEQNAWNAIQAALFGPSALDAADAYYAEGKASLTAGQTEKVLELEDMGIDRMTTYNLYQEFREINRDLDGTEASTAKRNAINNLDLTDQEKLEVYSKFVMDKSANNYEKNRQQFQNMLDAGLTWNDVTQAHNMKAMLDEDEELDGTGKATEFAKWVDQQSWTEPQKIAVEEKFKFWMQMPAQAANYDKFETAGVEASHAAEMAKLLADLTPEQGKQSVTNNQKILAIDRSSFSESEKVSAIAALVPNNRVRLVEAGVSDTAAKEIVAAIAVAEARNGDDELDYLKKAEMMLTYTTSDGEYLAAISTVLHESTYAKVELADSYGVPAEYWLYFKQTWVDTYGDDSLSQDKVEKVLKELGLSKDENAVLWQISNKSWKPKNNPYNKSIGEEIYEILNAE